MSIHADIGATKPCVMGPPMLGRMGRWVLTTHVDMYGLGTSTYVAGPSRACKKLICTGGTSLCLRLTWSTSPSTAIDALMTPGHMPSTAGWRGACTVAQLSMVDPLCDSLEQCSFRTTCRGCYCHASRSVIRQRGDPAACTGVWQLRCQTRMARAHAVAWQNYAMDAMILL